MAWPFKSAAPQPQTLVKCDECGLELPEKEVRYNPKWDNMICRNCVRNELIGNAGENKAIGSLVMKNGGAAAKAADFVFGRLPKKRPEKKVDGNGLSKSG